MNRTYLSTLDGANALIIYYNWLSDAETIFDFRLRHFIS